VLLLHLFGCLHLVRLVERETRVGEAGG
jgi:hypothetical protein